MLYHNQCILFDKFFPLYLYLPIITYRQSRASSDLSLIKSSTITSSCVLIYLEAMCNTNSDIDSHIKYKDKTWLDINYYFFARNLLNYNIVLSQNICIRAGLHNTDSMTKVQAMTASRRFIFRYSTLRFSKIESLYQP